MSPELKTISVDQVDPKLVDNLRVLTRSNSIIGEQAREVILKDFLATLGVDVIGSRVPVLMDGGILLLSLEEAVKNMLEARGRLKLVI